MKGEVAKITGLLMLLIACFYVGRRWATSYDQVLIVSTAAKGGYSNVETASPRTPFVALVPDPIRIHDLAALNITVPAPPPLNITVPAPPPAPLASPPPPARFGIVDANGAMQTDFRVGDEDDGDDVVVEVEVPDVDLANGTFGLGVGGPNSGFEGGDFTNLKRFGVCDGKMSEYVPCLDNLVAIRRLKSTERGETFERHCPSGAARLQCRVPTPPKYRTPIPWPRSRDQVWYSNVPHTKLVEDKGGQNWIQLRKNKFVFPGGGIQFIHGAYHYIDQMAQMVHDLAFGVHTRVALDVGCGVGSFGAFLLSRNVLTLSIAPKDVHENQIQFALERGVPAMIATFATRRLLYPSQAFDLIHCSRCRINWIRDGGILLLEVDRMLRAGGYFAWAAQPVYKHETNLQEAWKDMEDLATRLCWKLVNKEGYIAIWQKPFDNTCYVSRVAGVQPPLCDANDDPDDVWYVPLKACITQLPENGFGRNLTKWPERLHIPPDRLEVAPVDAYVAKKELFVAEQNYNRFLVESYWHGLGWKRQHFRNVMDMRAGFGGFATALVDLRVDCWVMNVVPVSGPNTLPVIYDRGLIGVVHDWCEPFDTYPRTYDLLYASGLYSIEEKRCNITGILLEMDRIMRPGAHAYIRDTRAVIAKIELVAKAIGWTTRTFDIEEGPYASRKILGCEKMLSHY